ncbi:hypothetical protein JTB14_031438 [Gonioctena quinquepunctata]|nr:hypothetical protein JTB14_031438 [Gonioctena quinquepunctata]
MQVSLGIVNSLWVVEVEVHFKNIAYIGVVGNICNISTRNSFIIFVDLPPPKQVDIIPRKPGRYELRIIIWNAEEILMGEDDFFTGERKSDIYIKGWLAESSEAQFTDVHYRSLTGEANFNWRFVFPFEYLLAEKKLVVRKKESIFALDEIEFKIPCVLNLQVWDNDSFSKDDFLGTLALDLSKMYRPAKIMNKCSLSSIKSGAPTINLFKIRRTRGWWPFKGKDPKTKQNICTGKVEAEIEILTIDNAIKEPAGLGRSGPQALSSPK